MSGMSFSLREIAAALGGEVTRGSVSAPGPGHSRRDRSLSIRPSVNSPEGFLVFSHAGDDFRECRDYVRLRLGLRADSWKEREWQPARGGASAAASKQDEIQVDDTKARIARARAIWDEGRDPRGTIAEFYLAGRGLELDGVVSGAAIRFHPACPWKEQGATTTLRVPCMLGAMRRIDTDEITAVHRTRLSPDGQKLGRMMLGPAAGTAIKLDPNEAVEYGLAVGEGIETTMAGRLLGFRPAWAAATAGGIARLPVMNGIDALTLLTERDETGANERATNECGERWHAAGREVVLVEPKTGNDVNDAIRGVA